VVDVKAIYSKAHRDRTADDFLNNLLNLMEPNGRFWGLSTPWHADDLDARLKRNPAYALFRRPVGEELQPVWQEHWPTPQLETRRGAIGSAAFARGYRLTPLAEDELVIRPEWVKTWSEKPASFERIILSVDPAVSLKPGADATAIVVLGKAGNEVYCLNADARRLTAPALVTWLEALDITWRPNEIVFESNGAFDAVRELLVKHAQFGPKVIGVKQSRSKLARFAAFAVPVQNGSFRLCGDGSQRNLFAEMTQFPFAEHDDLLDAAATGMNHLLQLRREPRVWDFWESAA
jgi:predicted phage terminase large subunit-like protein